MFKGQQKWPGREEWREQAEGEVMPEGEGPEQGGRRRWSMASNPTGTQVAFEPYSFLSFFNF